MNKLLKDFEKQEVSTRLDTLNHQIDLLNKENFKLKDELKKVKNNSSHAEVLRK
jgi:chaperonin cofactor prefoldin